MNSKIFRTIWAAVLATAMIAGVQAQTPKASSKTEAPVQTVGQAGPMLAQHFAFDKENQIFVGVNAVENAVDLIAHENGVMVVKKRFVTDNVVKRHDVERIYSPKSVAVYENHVLVLAAQRDSCYLAVLDMTGEEVQRLYFAGYAAAFTYNPEAKEIYIAGENNLGYDVAVLDASSGMAQLSSLSDRDFHYLKPKKAEEMKKNDPYGVALMIIAVSVVFFSLILLYLLFKGLGKAVMSFNLRRAVKAEQKATGGDKAAIKASIKEEDKGGEVYAAIAAAIYMYQNELHDEENTIITIEKVSRTYSPWSSKLYGMNPYFQIKNGK